MQPDAWETIRLPGTSTEEIWEVFHENSKTTTHEIPPSTSAIRARMDDLWESLPYDGYPEVILPTDVRPLEVPLGGAILGRETARSMSPRRVPLVDLATLLHHAYGVTRGNEGTVFQRPFRAVPSGGALYPLEIYFHTSHVEGLGPGIYHYNPSLNRLRLLYDGDASRPISEAVVQRNIPLDATVVFFLTAVFERSIFKYGNRGYRFVFLEAGHVAQNINLVAQGLGLGCTNVGGYFDRRIDALLGIDGLTHSTVYMLAIGQKVDAGPNGEAV